MANFFIKLYQAFQNRKWLLYLLMFVSIAVFAFFGLQIKYEEDVSKLLPTDKLNAEIGMAFTDLQVKDKIFLQFIAEDGVDVAQEELIAACDTFIEHIWNIDSTTQYIGNVLYSIDDETMINVMDYAMNNIPLLIDTSYYSKIDSLLSYSVLEKQMAKNRAMIDEDYEKASLVTNDPANLRQILLANGSSAPTDGLGGNFKMIDRHFFSKDSTVVLAFLAPNIQSLDSKAGTKLVELLESEMEEMKQYAPGVQLYFHGAPVNSVGNARTIKHDLVISIGFSLLLICLLVGFSFKNYSTLPMLLAPVIYGTLFALACVYWIQGRMSLLAIGLGAIVLGVALSYCIHVLTHYKYVNNPIKVLKEQTVPVVLSCLTTVGAFAGLLLTDSPLLKDFGIFASFALIGTTICCLVFLPHFFKLENNKRSKKMFAIFNRINAFEWDKQKWLVILLVVATIICAYTSRWVKFDSDLKNIGYFEPNVKRSQEIFAEKNNEGCSSVYFASTAATLDEALMYNKALQQTLDSLTSAGVVKSYSKMSQLLLSKEEEQARIEKWQSYFTPARNAEIRNTLSKTGKEYNFEPYMFESFMQVLEADYYPTSLVDADIVPQSMMSNVMEQSEAGTLVFTSVLMPPAERQHVSEVLAALPHIIVVDPFFYTNDMVNLVHKDFQSVLLISMIFVFLVLLISFRSISCAVLAFLPMACSWYIVQGVMGIFGIPFNLINIVISTFIFGIGVDYSIFIMDGLLASSKEGNKDLIMHHKTAILFSALVLIIVVASLMLAKHPVLSSIGVITMIGMVSTILLTHTLQPFLFRMLCKVPFYQKKFCKK